MQRHPLKAAAFAAVVAAGCLYAALAGAQMYKWTDADGKVHYSDQPPPANAKAETTIKPRKGAAQPAAAGTDAKEAPAAANKTPTYQEQEAAFKKRQVEAAEKEAADKKKADEAAEKKQNCKQAKEQVANLQNGGRITKTNTKGEREYLGDAEIALELDKAKKSVSTWCN
ncbi:MAG TPA: DUF4124 domain-containing protein [Burkholderiales bacterium]|nr:DUF4124 domain-containing protein [Burkholderiales bacterium]